MSQPTSVKLTELRQRLQASLDHKQDLGLDGRGSLYLRALGCLYLASEEPRDDHTPAEEIALETLYQEQARVEDVDPDDLLTRLILLVPEAQEVADQSAN